MKAPRTKFEQGAANKESAGFSLIELLVVVAVILIIAAIAVPNYIHSKERANETAAAANLRNISTANVVYMETYGIGFAASLGALGGNAATPTEASAGLIDSVLSSGVKSGYTYVYVPGSPDPNNDYQAYTVNANPIVPGTTGDKYFYTDQTNVIRFNTTTTAGPTDSPIQ